MEKWYHTISLLPSIRENWPLEWDSNNKTTEKEGGNAIRLGWHGVVMNTPLQDAVRLLLEMKESGNWEGGKVEEVRINVTGWLLYEANATRTRTGPGLPIQPF